MAGRLSCFAVYIEPTAPVIMGRRMNLDALLAALLLQRFRDAGIEEDEALRRAHSEIPLSRTKSVYAGSSALFPRTQTHSRTRYGSLQKHIAAIPNFDTVIAKSLSEKRKVERFDRIEGIYQTFGSVFLSYDLHRPTPEEMDHGFGIWFVGYGDRDETEKLMIDGLNYIGAKRTPIYTPVFYEAIPSKSPGLLGHDGSVLRPIPQSDGDPGSMKFSQAFERYHPPYWRSSLASDPVLCYVPPTTMWRNVGEIKRSIGVL